MFEVHSHGPIQYLPTIGNTTGLYSIYSTYQQYEVMFHVSTLLPFQVDDLQRVERKRHLGNDVVLVIFKEKNATFDPQCISSQFNSNCSHFLR
jgi:hypothetical protein